MIFSQAFGEESRDKKYLEFKERFHDRFGRNPNFAARLGYEAASLLITALEKNDDPKALKETLLKIQEFDGLTGRIVLDQYGDPKRKRVIMTVKDGGFKVIQ